MPRPHWHIRLRILKPLPEVLEGFNTGRFEVNHEYDINAPLCDLLIATGYAEPVADEEREHQPE